MALTLTKEQFFKEVCTLRNLWGTKTFWKNEKTIQLAKKGIAHCYFNTETNHQVDVIFQATLNEFLQRAMLMGVNL